MDFVKSVCNACGPQVDSLAEIILPPVLKLCERTNRVFLTRAHQVMQEYLRAAPVVKTVAPRLAEALKSPNKGLRAAATEFAELLIQLATAESLRESSDVIEKILIDGMGDATPPARESARKAFHVLKGKCPEMTGKIFDRVAPSVQKLLNDGPKTCINPLKRPTSLAKKLATTAPIHEKPSLAGVIQGHKIGGALRVLRSVTESPGLTPGSKAARVLTQGTNSASGTPVKGLKTSMSVAETVAPRAPSTLATCHSVGQLQVESSMSAGAVRAELVQAVMAARGSASDWADRQKAYESLAALVSNEDAQPHITASKAAAQRLFDCLLQGLSDSHFRVLESVVQYATALFGCCSLEQLPDPAMLDNMLARLVYLAVNPQYKGKPCQEAAPGLLDRLRDWLGDRWRLPTAISAAYSKPEATTSLKARLFMLARINAEIQDIDLAKCDEGELLFHLKTIIARITPALLDHDQALVSSAVSLFSSIHLRLQNETLLEALVTSVKFAAARTILIQRLQISVGAKVPEALEAIKEIHTAEEHEDMELERQDSPDPLFIMLDDEVQLKIRPLLRTSTPPIDELARTLSSVLQSPFVEDDENREPEMRTIDEQIKGEILCKVDFPLSKSPSVIQGELDEEPNPFLTA